jgi:hypothetical protein
MLPIQLDAAPSVFDLAAEVGPPLKAKVGGGLSGGFPVCDPLEYFFGQKIALYVEGGVFHGFGFFGKKTAFWKRLFWKKKGLGEKRFFGKKLLSGGKAVREKDFLGKRKKKIFSETNFFSKKIENQIIEGSSTYRPSTSIGSTGSTTL